MANQKYTGNIITDVETVPTAGGVADGIWGISEIHQARGSGIWPGQVPSGGTRTNPSGTTYLHVFNSTDTFVNPLSSLSVEYLVVAGGASGGRECA